MRRITIISSKLSDDQFIKLSWDYDQEQEQLKAVVETLGWDVKQQAEKTNVRKVTSMVKKYTKMTQLDAIILREFVEQIRDPTPTPPTNSRSGGKSERLRSSITSIGAFDFEGAREQFQTAQDNKQYESRRSLTPRRPAL